MIVGWKRREAAFNFFCPDPSPDPPTPCAAAASSFELEPAGANTTGAREIEVVDGSRRFA